MNITNEPVTVRTWLDPINLWAIVPLDNEWPYVPNPDSLPFCYYHYTWFGGNDAIIDDYRTTIQPYDTLIAPVGTEAVNKCFQEATYLFLSAISDLSNYPEYFDPAYVYGYLGGDKKALYEKMNRSLLKKLELFQPAVVNIIK